MHEVHDATGTNRGEQRDKRPIEGRLVVLGVTGSIAAYKAAEISRALQAAGADVQVLMTRSAAQFVGPLTFETLTRRRVMLDPLELLPDNRIGHIVAADTADAIVVAPATARFIGAIANGLADDVVTTTCLASAAPVVVAPAMDGEMYAHPATRANVDRLRGFGYTIVDPERGALASGQVGEGRFAPVERIVSAVVDVIRDRPIRAPDSTARPPLDESIRAPDLEGRRIIVTAGGTAEPIDPVRFIGNRSSGRMGTAIAAAAARRGAEVTLIHASTTVPLPDVAKVVFAATTAEMRREVLAELAGADALVMAAAVADFRPTRAADRKISRDGGLTLELEPTEDILAEAAAQNRSAARRAIVVAFAAETGSLNRAAEKLERKGADFLIANDVSEEGSGFGAETNRVTLLAPGADPDPWPLLTKDKVADRILDRISALLLLRDTGLGDRQPEAHAGGSAGSRERTPGRADAGEGRIESGAAKPVSEVAP